VLVGIAFAVAECAHDIEDRVAADPAGHCCLRHRAAGLRDTDVEFDRAAEAGKRDILRGRPDEAAAKR
jgi:hypothetical protein